MEDSGIDSEGKLSASFEDITKTSDEHKIIVKKELIDDYDVIFREGGSNETTDPEGMTIANSRNQPHNTCRILQRKLELKVERAKRNHTQLGRQSQAANLIPINRLSIPENLEKKPLVDYNSDNSDDPIEVSFFASKLQENKNRRHHELSDTFSIQEMTTESDRESDDGGAQNLELLPPMAKTNFLDRLISCFNCKSLSL